MDDIGMAKGKFDRKAIEPIIIEKMKDGELLRVICKGKKMPSSSTVNAWANEKATGKDGRKLVSFGSKFTAAREEGAFAMLERAEEAIQTSIGGMDLQKARELLRAAQWRCTKLNRRQFGDRQEVAITGAGGGPLVISWKK